MSRSLCLWQKVRWPFLGPIWKLPGWWSGACSSHSMLWGHRSFPITDGSTRAPGGTYVHAYGGVGACAYARSGEDTTLCVPGSYLNKSCRDGWFSLASPDPAAFACPSGTTFLPLTFFLSPPNAHTPPSAPPPRSLGTKVPPKTPPLALSVAPLLPRKPSSFWTLDELQDKTCGKSEQLVLWRRDNFI